jgi:hypothetical protein
MFGDVNENNRGIETTQGTAATFRPFNFRAACDLPTGDIPSGMNMHNPAGNEIDPVLRWQSSCRAVSIVTLGKI